MRSELKRGVLGSDIVVVCGDGDLVEEFWSMVESLEGAIEGAVMC